MSSISFSAADRASQSKGLMRNHQNNLNVHVNEFCPYEEPPKALRKQLILPLVFQGGSHDSVGILSAS
jgi:hypothetical protein